MIPAASCGSGDGVCPLTHSVIREGAWDEGRVRTGGQGPASRPKAVILRWWDHEQVTEGEASVFTTKSLIWIISKSAAGFCEPVVSSGSYTNDPSSPSFVKSRPPLTQFSSAHIYVLTLCQHLTTQVPAHRDLESNKGTECKHRDLEYKVGSSKFYRRGTDKGHGSS